MSCHGKYPKEKKDTPSESSEPCSDKEVEKTEENLEQLQIEEDVKKEIKETEESKQLDSPDQDGTLTSTDLPDEPIPGPSGLQNPHLESSDGSFDKDFYKSDASTEPQSKRPLSAKRTVPGVVTEMEVSESEESSEPCARTVPMVGRGNLRLLQEMQRFDSSRYRRFIESSSTTTDSQATSLDVSDIRTDLADNSTEGSVYHDAPENVERDQSSSYASAMERQSTESSDTNASELQEDSLPPSTVSISTATAEQGHRAYVERLQREADQREEPASTSSGFGSTIPSELANLQHWGMVGEMGGYRRNVEDDVNHPQDAEHDVSIERQQQPSGSLEESSSEGQRLEQMERLLQAGAGSEENPEPSSCAEGMEENEEESLQQIEKCEEVSDREMAAPRDRRKNLVLLSSDSSSAEKKPTGKMLRSRSRPELARKAKIANKSSIPLGSSSESNEPKSSSSDGSHPKEPSPEIKSSSDAQDASSCSETARRPWQKSGRLRSMQRSTMSSKESVIKEDEEPVAISKGGRSEITEATEACLESLEASPGEPKDVDTNPEQLESESSVPETSSSMHVMDPASPKEKDLSLEAEPERSVGKSKRTEAKLSTSPPSDERPSATCPKAATNRPMKKSRRDKKSKRTRRTRHNSGGSLKDVGRELSASTPDNSDYVLSEDDEESAL